MHHAIFGETIKDRDFNKTLSYLEKVGVIYCKRTYGNEIINPEYFYSIQPHIEAKLPHVEITEVEEE